MKKKLFACIIFISQLFLAQLALAYTITPSTFADNFNRINQRLAGGMYRAIKLNDKQGQYNFSLATYINLTVATTDSQVKNINLICSRTERTLEKCIRSTAWIGSAVDSQFNQVKFMSVVNNMFDNQKTTVRYQQNGVRYVFKVDKIARRIVLEIRPQVRLICLGNYQVVQKH